MMIWISHQESTAWHTLYLREEALPASALREVDSNNHLIVFVLYLSQHSFAVEN